MSNYREQVDLLHPSSDALQDADYPFLSGFQTARHAAAEIACAADAEIENYKAANAKLLNELKAEITAHQQHCKWGNEASAERDRLRTELERARSEIAQLRGDYTTEYFAKLSAECPRPEGSNVSDAQWADVLKRLYPPLTHEEFWNFCQQQEEDELNHHDCWPVAIARAFNLIRQRTDLLAALEDLFPLALAHATVHNLNIQPGAFHPVHEKLIKNAQAVIASAKGNTDNNCLYCRPDGNKHADWCKGE